MTVSTTPAKPSFEIVIGHDYSPLADSALTEGVRLAARTGHATIHIVHAVAEHLTLTELESSELDVNRRVHPLVSSVLRSVGADDTIRMLTHVRQGRPATEILGLAADVEADLIVLGTHGRTGLPRLALGSVAEDVMRHACCPVYVVRAKEYGHASAELVPDPPCADCVATRRRTGGTSFWCAAHSEQRRRPHIYSYQGSELHSLRSDGLG